MIEEAPNVVTEDGLRGLLANGYRIEETGGLVRLSKASLAGSELLSSAKGEASPVLAEYLAGRDA